MLRKSVFTALALSASIFSQTDINPAARRHVRIEEGKAVKYTSKLSHVVELNFAFGYHHGDGKAVITQSLDRIAKKYAVDGKDAFTLNLVASGKGGTEKAAPPFSLADMLAAEVIVANNISAFNDTSLGEEKRTVIRTAIESEGRGYLAFHGSAENKSGNPWPWYSEVLDPRIFQGHYVRKSFPVYKHLEEGRHLVLQKVLETGTTPAKVPNELDVSGLEDSAQNVPTREAILEPMGFDGDFTRDPAYRDKVTVLLKYDIGKLPEDFDYVRRIGGNLYGYLYQVGNGLTSYFYPGHGLDETMDPIKGFDGGVGDFDRYVAQTLFFLAGYAQEPCDATCEGLPIVDAKNRLIGNAYAMEPTGIRPGPGRAIALHPELRFHSAVPGFASNFESEFEATVSDMDGRILARKSGRGRVDHAFQGAVLKPGVYILRVRVGSRPAQVKRYAMLSGSR